MKDFIKGVGSVIDIFPSRKNIDFNISKCTDAEALRKDWEIVGNALRSSMERVKGSNGN